MASLALMNIHHDFPMTHTSCGDIFIRKYKRHLFQNSIIYDKYNNSHLPSSLISFVGRPPCPKLHNLSAWQCQASPSTQTVNTIISHYRCAQAFCHFDPLVIANLLNCWAREELQKTSKNAGNDVTMINFSKSSGGRPPKPYPQSPFGTMSWSTPTPHHLEIHGSAPASPHMKDTVGSLMPTKADGSLRLHIHSVDGEHIDAASSCMRTSQ